MSIYRRAEWYWTDFCVDGQRYRRPLQDEHGRRITNWQEAKRREREMIETARNGQLHTQAAPKRLFEAIKVYLAQKAVACAGRTVELESERLSLVKQHFGDAKLSTITPAAIAGYQQARHKSGIAGRTINMDIGALRRVLKQCGHWRRLQDQVQSLPENQVPIGRALTLEEQQRLFDAALSNAEWEHVYCAAMIAANTSMRPVEVKNLRWQDVDLFDGTLTVRRSKNQTSLRVIPLNKPARTAFGRMLERAQKLGFDKPEHYIWAACQWHTIDPTRPIQKWDTAWRKLRDAAGLTGLRFHDLRHTIITELAEMGVPDHVMESISGHMSRRMLEHYSHVRIAAKRKALEDLDAWREKAGQEAKALAMPRRYTREEPLHSSSLCYTNAVR
jgi:integrase